MGGVTEGVRRSVLSISREWEAHLLPYLPTQKRVNAMVSNTYLPTPIIFSGTKRDFNEVPGRPRSLRNRYL